MKSTIRKALAIVLILAVSCLPMAAYAVPDVPDVEVVGIIGSADGPTEILVAERVDMDPPMWQQWGFKSLEDMLEAYGMTEDEYYKMVAMEMEWQQDYKNWRNEELKKLGGTVGVTNVMVNGKFAQFGGAVPEVTNGTTYAPVRPVLSLLGATFNYDAGAQTVTAKYGDTSLLLTIGETDMTVSRGGEDTTADIKAAPYLKGGSAYIPVRAVFEALGCEVFWDYDYSTVVVIDKAAVIAEIDKDFTILNKLLKMSPAAPSGAQKLTMDTAVDVTMFDTINGDKIAKATANLSALYDEDSLSLSAQYDIAALIDMLYVDVFGYGAASEDDIPAALKSSKFDMIVDTAEGVLYLKSPLLEEMDSEIPSGAWLELDADEFLGIPLDEVDETMGEAIGEITVGVYIYETQIGYYSYYSQIHLYDNLMSAANSARAIFGDKLFTVSGNNYTLSIKQNNDGSRTYVSSMLSMLTGAYNAKSGLDVNVTIKTDGKAITAVTGDLKLDLSDSYYGVLVTGSIDMSASGAKLSFEVHVKNTVKVLVNVDSKTTAYSGDVPNAPPEGDTVISMDDIYGSYDSIPPAISNYVN